MGLLKSIFPPKPNEITKNGKQYTTKIRDIKTTISTKKKTMPSYISLALDPASKVCLPQVFLPRWCSQVPAYSHNSSRQFYFPTDSLTPQEEASPIRAAKQKWVSKAKKTKKSKCCHLRIAKTES